MRPSVRESIRDSTDNFSLVVSPFRFLLLKPRVECYTQSMSHKNDPASDSLHISAMQLFPKWELYLIDSIPPTQPRGNMWQTLRDFNAVRE